MTQLWVISTVKGREKKEKKKLLAGGKKTKDKEAPAMQET